MEEGPEKRALKYSTIFANFYWGKKVFLCSSHHFFGKMANILFSKKEYFCFFKGNVCALPLPPVVRSIHWAVKRAGNGEEKEKGTTLLLLLGLEILKEEKKRPRPWKAEMPFLLLLFCTNAYQQRKVWVRNALSEEKISLSSSNVKILLSSNSLESPTFLSEFFKVL